MDGKDYVKIADVAKRYNVSRVTVWTWIKNGKLPAYRIGKVYRIKREDADAIGEQKGGAA